MDKATFEKLLDKINRNPNLLENCKLDREVEGIQDFKFEFKGLKMEIGSSSIFDEDHDVVRESVILMVFPLQDSAKNYTRAAKLSSTRFSTRPYQYEYEDEEDYRKLENLFETVKSKAFGIESAVMKILED